MLHASRLSSSDLVAPCITNFSTMYEVCTVQIPVFQSGVSLAESPLPYERQISTNRKRLPAAAPFPTRLPNAKIQYLSVELSDI
jgi:hypothetical protein